MTRRLPAVELVIFITYVMPTNNDIPFLIQKFEEERASQSFPVFCSCFTLAQRTDDAVLVKHTPWSNPLTAKRDSLSNTKVKRTEKTSSL